MKHRDRFEERVYHRLDLRGEGLQPLHLIGQRGERVTGFRVRPHGGLLVLPLLQGIDEFIDVRVLPELGDLFGVVQSENLLPLAVREPDQELCLIGDETPTWVPHHLQEALDLPLRVVPHEGIEALIVLPRVPDEVPVVHRVGVPLHRTIGLVPCFHEPLGAVHLEAKRTPLLCGDGVRHEEACGDLLGFLVCHFHLPFDFLSPCPTRITTPDQPGHIPLVVPWFPLVLWGNPFVLLVTREERHHLTDDLWGDVVPVLQVHGPLNPTPDALLRSLRGSETTLVGRGCLCAILQTLGCCISHGLRGFEVDVIVLRRSRGDLWGARCPENFTHPVVEPDFVGR